MPKDNEVNAKVMPVAWIVTNGGESCEPWLEYEQREVDALPAVCIAEPLYSAATVAELRAEVDRLQAIEEAARIYYREYCQDEAGDEPDDDGRGLWTGASAKQINDAAALRDALTGADPT